MVRTGLLVTLGIGVVGLPDGSSLLPFALVVTALFAIPPWWRRKPRVRVQLPARLPNQLAHYHYCDACDQQWRHHGADCIAHWASHCPACAVAHERRTGSAGLTPV